MKRVLLPLSVCILATPAFAESKVGQVSINPFVGYSVQDSKRELNDGVAYGINGEFRATENWATRLFYVEAGTENEGVAGQSDNSVDYMRYGFDALYYFMPESAVQPYLLAGIGNGEYESDNETQLNFGAGVRYFLSQALSVNGELKMSHSADDDLDDGLVSLGVAYAFGGSKAKAAPAPVAAAPVDSDGDGVIDANDKCPGTPAGVTVDANGCELDSDRDGVVDSKDACPGTPAGTKVDARGCVPKKATIETIKLNILFATNSDVVTEQYQGEVKRVADFLKSYQDVSVEIEGHTDAQGADAYNQALSQRRADSVKKALVTRYGIAAERVKAIGYGESRPVASNDTAAGRAENRRVVAVMQKEILE